MIGQKHRFHGYGGLRSVYQRGQTVRGAALSLRYSQRDGAKPYRVAVVVSRKVSKSAVVRNRIRRRIYEIVRQNQSLVPEASDLVFTVFAEQLAEIKAVNLEKTVLDLLQKART